MSVNTLDRDVARLLQEGQSAARRGDRAMARALLTQLVEQDPRNEEAWMWLSGVVSDPDEQQICLENALVINPYNAHARKGLEFVLTKTNTPSRVPLTLPAPEGTADNAAAASVPAPAQPADSTQMPVQADDAPAGFAASAAPVPVNPASGMASETPFHDALMSNPESFPVVPASPMLPVDATSNMDAFVLTDTDVALDFDGQPFIPPGMEDFGSPSMSAHHTGPTGSLLGATADQIGDELPNWLQELTPTPPSHGPEDETFAPYNMSDYPSQHSNNGMQGMSPASPAPAQPFGPADFGALNDFDMGVAMGGPVGPFSDLQMPQPHELPGGDGFAGGSSHGHGPELVGGPSSKSNSAQPWYLQGAANNRGNGGSAYLDSTMLKSSSLSSTMLTSSIEDKRKAVATIPCPNCQIQVNETALACPSCRYSFFANCPHCHELLDTGEAVRNQVDTCQHCHKEVNRFNLGLGGVPDMISQKNPGSRPAEAGAGPEPALMVQTLEINTPYKKGLSFSWLVDLLWLIAIVAMVWALTQLPAWLHLSGQY